MTSSYNQNTSLQEQSVRSNWARNTSPHDRMYAVSRVWINDQLRLPLTRELFESHFSDEDRNEIRELFCNPDRPSYVDSILYQGYTDLYEYLADQGILLDDLTSFTWLGRHSVDCVDRILEKYEQKIDNPERRMMARRFVFGGAAIYRNSVVMKTLFDKGLGSHRDVQRALNRALIDAVEHRTLDDHDTIAWLIEKGADVNRDLGITGYSQPLLVAAKNGDLEGIDFLISKGAVVTSGLVAAFNWYCTESNSRNQFEEVLEKLKSEQDERS